MDQNTAKPVLGLLLILGTVGTWISVFFPWSEGVKLFEFSDATTKVFSVSALAFVSLALFLHCCTQRKFKTMVGCVCSIGLFALVAIIVFAASVNGPLQAGFYLMMSVAILFCCCGCCLGLVNDDPGTDLTDLHTLLASADPAMVQRALNAVLMQAGGFLMCTDNVSQALKQTLQGVNPTGGTALYDAIAQGTTHILRLQSLLLSLGVRQQKFIHVIVTDGEDTHSNYSLDQTCGLMRQIAPLSEVVQTVIVAVSMSSSSGGYRALQRLSSAGGAACKILDADSANIGDVFERLSATISRTVQVNVVPGSSSNSRDIISNRAPLLQATQTTAVELNVNFFAVFLELDMSGSMSGSRWKSLTAGVRHLLDNLTPLDAVGCVLFNTSPALITKA